MRQITLTQQELEDLYWATLYAMSTLQDADPNYFARLVALNLKFKGYLANEGGCDVPTNANPTDGG